MNDSHWYPRNPQAYLTDTAWCDHATEVAHVRLIDTYYALGKPIKDEQSRIQNIGKIALNDYQRVKGNLMELGWRIEEGMWRHKRIDETLADMEKRRQEQTDRTKAATEARMAKRNERADVQRNVQRNVERPKSPTCDVTKTQLQLQSQLQGGNPPIILSQVDRISFERELKAIGKELGKRGELNDYEKGSKTYKRMTILIERQAELRTKLGVVA